METTWKYSKLIHMKKYSTTGNILSYYIWKGTALFEGGVGLTENIHCKPYGLYLQPKYFKSFKMKYEW